MLPKSHAVKGAFESGAKFGYVTSSLMRIKAFRMTHQEGGVTA